MPPRCTSDCQVRKSIAWRMAASNTARRPPRAPQPLASSTDDLVKVVLEGRHGLRERGHQLGVAQDVRPHVRGLRVVVVQRGQGRLEPGRRVGLGAPRLDVRQRVQFAEVR